MRRGVDLLHKIEGIIDARTYVGILNKIYKCKIIAGSGRLST